MTRGQLTVHNTRHNAHRTAHHTPHTTQHTTHNKQHTTHNITTTINDASRHDTTRHHHHTPPCEGLHAKLRDLYVTHHIVYYRRQMICRMNTQIHRYAIQVFATEMPVRKGNITPCSSPPRPQSSKLKRKRGDGFTKSGVYFARRSTAMFTLSTFYFWGKGFESRSVCFWSGCLFCNRRCLAWRYDSWT